MFENHQVIVIGAGPAGLQLGYDLKQLGFNYLILEKDEKAGAFFKKFPVHRMLISINKPNTGFEDKETNLRWDWNSLLSDGNGLLFEKYSQEYFPQAGLMVDYLNDYAKEYNLNIDYNSDVVNIDKKDDLFHVTTKDNRVYTCQILVVASGVSKPYVPPVPGLELAEKYFDLTLDKSKYKNKRVLIVGKGNSAFETADYLIDTASHIHMVSPTPLKFAWKSHYVGHLRAVNNNFLDTYQLKSLNAIMNADVANIAKTDSGFNVTFNYHFANDEVETIYYDHVICSTGFQMDSSIFAPTLQPELTIYNRFPRLKSHFESVNIPDLYFIGTIMQSRDFKRKQSGFIHGFRYNVRFLSNYFNWRYRQIKLENKSIDLSVKGVSQCILDVVNQSSALWQQTGYFCDVITLDKKNNQAKHYSSLPYDFVTEGILGCDDYLTITLEFGQKIIDEADDVFMVERVHKHDHENAHLSTFIHPIVRYYHKNELCVEHHIIEDLEAVWREDEHIKPLENWLKVLLEGHQSSYIENAQMLSNKRGDI